MTTEAERVADALEKLYREYEEAAKTLGIEVPPLDQDKDYALVRLNGTREQQTVRADWGRNRAKPVVCEPCKRGNHALCVRPCVCLVRARPVP